MDLQRDPFGTLDDGTPVELFTLTGAIVVRIASFGATITELHAPDRHGRHANVVLGFGDLGSYARGCPYFGATIGRVANRIRGASFELDGRAFDLPANNGPHHLHGGPRGWDKAVWRPEPRADAFGPSVLFHHVSPDGDAGYPGRVEASVRYTLTRAGDLVVDEEGVTDAPTPLNLTNHSYFNLAGAGQGTILDHELTLDATRYLPTTPERVPTGDVLPVDETPFDFRDARAIGRGRAALPSGYDHPFVANPAAGLRRIALLRDPRSGRTLEIGSTKPSVQFYDGDFLDGSITGNGGTYVKNGALCLEPQGYPDAVHHKAFPTVVLRPGETYRHRTVYRFGAT